MDDGKTDRQGSDSTGQTVAQKCKRTLQCFGHRLYNGSPYAILPMSFSVLSVCDVGILWPNGWMDQDETWHGCRPRPRPHCVRWGSSSPPPKVTQPPILAHVCCDQTARWIKIPIGMEVGLGPGDIVLDRDPAPPLKRGGGHSSPQFSANVMWPNDRMDQHATW